MANFVTANFSFLILLVLPSIQRLSGCSYRLPRGRPCQVEYQGLNWGFAQGNTVLFHSIRHPAWRVTSLPKFRFRQAPDVNVTSKYFRQVGCKFCVRSLKIVHCQLNYIYYLHNVCKRDRRASGIFFIFNSFYRIFRWFRHLTKICVTCVTFRQIWGLHDALLPNWMK